MAQTINTALLPMKGHYFFFTFGTGPILANIAIIARQKGFSSSIVGILLTVFHVVSTLTKPIICWMADRFKIHVGMLTLMIGVTGLTFASVYFIPSISNQMIYRVEPNGSTIIYCPSNPVWDQCLDHRIQNSVSKTFKCQLSCSAEAPSEDHSYESDIVLDIRTLQTNATCLTVEEFRNELTDIAGSVKESRGAKCDVTCEDDMLKGTLVDRGAIPDDQVHLKYQFWLFGILFLIGFSAKSVVYSISDTICFDLLGDDQHKYGQQRMWDSVGSGINSVIIGAVIDAMSGESAFKNYAIIFYVCFISLALNMLCAIKLKFNQPKKSKTIVRDVAELCKSLKAVTFFVWCCLGGFFSAGVWSFLFWHLEELADKIGQEECGGSYIKTLEGIDLFIQCVVGEIPVLFFSGKIINKLGHVNCMNLIFGAFAVRFYYLSQLTNPWWVLPIEVTNGITYGLHFATIASYANILAPHGAEATLQGLVGALFEGVGVSTGNFVAGILFEVVGGNQAFKIFSYIAFGAMIVHILIHKLINYLEKQDNKAVHKVVVDMET